MTEIKGGGMAKAQAFSLNQWAFDVIAQHKRQMSGRAQPLKSRAVADPRLVGNRMIQPPAPPSDLLAQLAEEGEQLRLPTGELLVQEAAVAESALVLDEGVLMKFKGLPGDRRQISGFTYAPALLLPPRFGAPWSHGLQAVTAVAFKWIGQRAFEQALLRDARLYPLLLAAARVELLDQEDLLLTLACKTPPEKIASFLLHSAQRSGGATRADGMVELPMTRVQIADHLGLAPETVSRAFARLTADGLVALPRPSRVVLRDRAALRALAEGRAKP